jgi:hypothetical protein
VHYLKTLPVSQRIASSVRRLAKKGVTNMWQEAVVAQLQFNTDKYAGGGDDKAEEETCPDKLCNNIYEKHTSCYTTDNRLRPLVRY